MIFGGAIFIRQRYQKTLDALMISDVQFIIFRELARQILLFNELCVIGNNMVNDPRSISAPSHIRLDFNQCLDPILAIDDEQIRSIVFSIHMDGSIYKNFITVGKNTGYKYCYAIFNVGAD